MVRATRSGSVGTLLRGFPEIILFPAEMSYG
jgi:hypothetical protein